MRVCRKELDNISAYKPGKPVEEVKRSLGLKDVYKLASNEIPFYPAHIVSVIKNELKNINRYPQADCFYLRKIIAKKLSINGQQIVFGNGSDEVISLTLRALINKGDEVIVGYPTFLIYEIQAKIHNAKVIKVPLDNFKYSLSCMAAKVTKKTKLIFIANPDNPTGTCLTHKEIKSFLNKIPRSVVVYFDEAYFEFAPSGYPQSLKFLKERGNIIVGRSFSKAYGLAGMRIGYGVTTLDIAETLNKIREPFNVNRLAQVAAISALGNKKFLNKVVSHTKKEKEYIYRELKKFELFFVKSATNFVLVDFKRNTSDLYKYLLRKGIIVRELSGWGLPNFFRITIGLHKENKKFISCLKSYLLKQDKGEI